MLCLLNVFPKHSNRIRWMGSIYENTVDSRVSQVAPVSGKQHRDVLVLYIFFSFVLHFFFFKNSLSFLIAFPVFFIFFFIFSMCFIKSKVNKFVNFFYVSDKMKTISIHVFVKRLGSDVIFFVLVFLIFV